MNYTHWNSLNTMYFTQIKSINHDSNEVIIDIPEGRYSQSEIQKIHKEYRNLPGVTSLKMKSTLSKAKVGRVVSVPSRRGTLLSLRNTWWVKVEDRDSKEKIVKEELSNETVKHTPLYHKYRNKTENSFWENHCSLH